MFWLINKLRSSLTSHVYFRINHYITGQDAIAKMDVLSNIDYLHTKMEIL